MGLSHLCPGVKQPGRFYTQDLRQDQQFEVRDKARACFDAADDVPLQIDFLDLQPCRKLALRQMLKHPRLPYPFPADILFPFVVVYLHLQFPLPC